MNRLDESETRAVETYRRLDATSTEAERASARASGVGAFFSNAIRQVRGGTDEFYHNLIAAVKIALCEHDLAKNTVRFVNSSAANVYKDGSGDCVRLRVSNQTDSAAVDAYDEGLCEVQPNCYWAPIEDGDTNRAKVYADPGSAMNKDAANAQLKQWVLGVVGFVVPGIALGVASLLSMIFFLICRCCCNRCGGRYPRTKGYTRAQQLLPLLLFLLLSIAVFVVSTAALLYRDSILGAVDEIFHTSSGLLENGSDWVVSIRTPLENVRDKVNSSVELVIMELNGSDFIENGVYGLIGKLRAFGDFAANRTLPDGCSVNSDQSKDRYIGTNGNVCLPCDACTTISVEIDTASDQIEAKADPGVQQLITVRSQLNDKLVNAADSVRDAVGSKVQLADELLTTLEATREKVDKYDGTFQTSRADFGIDIMRLFYFAVGVIALGVVGILFGLTPLKSLVNLIHVAYVCGFIVLVVIFIVSSVVLALGIVLGDTCEIALIFSTNWTVPLGDSARAVDACFRNESLLDVFNLSTQLAFARGGINFPTIDVSAMLDFSALDNFSSQMQTTEDDTFAFSDAYFDEVVAFVNSYASQDSLYCKLNDEYTIENVLHPWQDNGESSAETPVEYITQRYGSHNTNCSGLPPPDYGQPFVCTSHSNPCQFSAFMGEQFSVLVNLANINNSIAVFVDQLQQNVTDVVDFTHEFKANISSLLGRIERIKDNLKNSLIKYVDDFEKVMYCTFIADGFFNMYDAVCVHMAPSITMIGLMLLAVGMLLVPVNIVLIIGVKRLKARRFGPVMASNTKFTDMKITRKVLRTKIESAQSVS
ncbi:hypothetical protein PF005_g7432 [Phytophthora fragariae]|uniref:Uncharacterized protein n=1 Tax=Phytophthora fragariae TaxID=53985 RepID=A0A6A3ZVV4_9STRA|nr:hypothetical protein PF003_g37531 [Phytophthora fragariae]KAE8942391.1 hypothetical protein PF009_g7836 [Phytophthora fragariae]KAE9018701.1 hypothetical protein PF011_g6147 [Phytophthora fragariae]KAE9122288.1 hypothetical protein PF007_g7501 [Phytophthora fragariae]KAE9148983.1 hypothetical protein PF006_g6486 [Phytophthora fragariae]